MKNNSLMIVIIAVIALGAGFFVGMKYQSSKTPAQTMQFLGRNRPFTSGGRFGGGQGGGRVVGQVITSDEKSITVKLADGSSKIVILSDKTAINKASSATKSDLTEGTNVAVFGTDNSDGSVTAQNIQVNPLFERNGPPGASQAP